MNLWKKMEARKQDNRIVVQAATKLFESWDLWHRKDDDEEYKNDRGYEIYLKREKRDVCDICYSRRKSNPFVE